jgi:hypothetical protein
VLAVPERADVVTADTVHLFAQLIRHQRALATSLEKWIKSPTFSKDEALSAVFVFRGVLDSYEAQLSRVTTSDQRQ